ncbi:MAG: hypothetical protein ACJ768_19695 [Gaiellaceae bacterium]
MATNRGKKSTTSTRGTGMTDRNAASSSRKPAARRDPEEGTRTSGARGTSSTKKPAGNRGMKGRGR